MPIRLSLELNIPVALNGTADLFRDVVKLMDLIVLWTNPRDLALVE